MEKINFDLQEISSFIDKLEIIVPKDYDFNYEKIAQSAYKAFLLEELPDDEVLEMVSTTETIEDAIDEYWLPGISDSDKNKAAVRKMIELVKNKRDLQIIFGEVIRDIDPESYEFKLFIRKAAEIL